MSISVEAPCLVCGEMATQTKPSGMIMMNGGRVIELVHVRCLEVYYCKDDDKNSQSRGELIEPQNKVN